MSITLERTADGRRLCVSRRIDAPASAVWEVLTDTDLWSEWGPSVTAVDCDHRFVESGTTGRVRIVGGLWVPFEVTGCDEFRWTWSVGRIPATGHRVDPDDGTCTAVFEIPPLAAGYAPVCDRALDRIASLV